MHTSIITACMLSAALLDGIAAPNGDPLVVLRTDSGSVTFLSWDTEGGDRASKNLLRGPLELSYRADDEWQQINPAASDILVHSMELSGSTIQGRFALARPVDTPVRAVRLVVPFDPRTAATTVIPSAWSGANEMRLPAIISAPDFGQMLLTASTNENVVASLHGRRDEVHAIDLHLDWIVDSNQQELHLTLEPLHIPQPQGLADTDLWRAIRRGWFNMLQPSAQWGTEGRPQYAPPGLLANNVVSDPVSCVIHMKADHVLLVPDLGAGVRATVPLRNTLDWWLDHGINEQGEMKSWREVRGMLDANAGPLIGAWCYVEASGDTAWLAKRISVLERLADYLAARDIDGDGMVESPHSGDYGALVGRLGASAYDTINSGHKDGYTNALTYRAWLGLADLERKLGRDGQAERYTHLAQRLKQRYAEVLYNPETGWLAWWQSEDGELHDLSAPMITSIAILYGLVDPEAGRPMLEKLWQKIEAAGFTRFDLGVPLTLEPVRKGDYQQPKPGSPPGTYGRPAREDGSDTFQQYLNGGCCVSDAYYFITALHIVGEHEKADTILHAMLKRQVEGVFENGGGFQNGVVDQFPHGAEFYDWSGNTTGYEGHLVYSFSFLQAVLLRDPEIRNRVLRPLMAE
jgi:hypothetical protein